MTQKSPTNEDASDVIVIWFRDAGITYLQDERFQLLTSCYTSVFHCKNFDNLPIQIRPIFDDFSNHFRRNFELSFDELQVGLRRTMLKFPYFFNKRPMRCNSTSSNYTRQTCRTLISVCFCFFFCQKTKFHINFPSSFHLVLHFTWFHFIFHFIIYQFCFCFGLQIHQLAQHLEVAFKVHCFQCFMCFFWKGLIICLTWFLTASLRPLFIVGTHVHAITLWTHSSVLTLTKKHVRLAIDQPPLRCEVDFVSCHWVP